MLAAICVGALLIAFASWPAIIVEIRRRRVVIRHPASRGRRGILSRHRLLARRHPDREAVAYTAHHTGSIEMPQ